MEQPRIRSLIKGDTVGVITPSNAIRTEQEEQIKKGISKLSKLGLKTTFATNAYSNSLKHSPSPKEKIKDIHEMFLDKSIKAIICSQGGETTNSCLEGLDFELIRSNPKIFIGMSDNSILLNAIFKETGLITFHGSDLIWGLGKHAGSYDLQQFKERFFSAKTGIIHPNSERITVRSGQKIKGKLLGGNIRCLLKTAGTPWFPDFKDSILFLEAASITEAASYYMFHQLKQLGVFDKTKGVIVGYIHSMQNITMKRSPFEEILYDVTSEYNLPILKINDFGHVCQNCYLPVGAEISLDTHNQQLEILENYIKKDE